MAFQGADALSVNARGDLVLKCADEEILQRAPRLYQQSGGKTRLISGHYALKGKNVVGFEVGAFDHKRPLTIDPVLISSTFLGGQGQNAAEVVAVDANGCIYVTGMTRFGMLANDDRYILLSRPRPSSTMATSDEHR